MNVVSSLGRDREPDAFVSQPLRERKKINEQEQQTSQQGEKLCRSGALYALQIADTYDIQCEKQESRGEVRHTRNGYMVGIVPWFEEEGDEGLDGKPYGKAASNPQVMAVYRARRKV